MNLKFHLSHAAKIVRVCKEIYGVKNAIFLHPDGIFLFRRTPVDGWNAFDAGICFCFPVPAGIPGEVWLHSLHGGGA